MRPLSRRDFLDLALAATGRRWHRPRPRRRARDGPSTSTSSSSTWPPARKQRAGRGSRPSTSKADLDALQIVAARDVSPPARRLAREGRAFRRSRRPGRSRPTITWSRSSSSRAFPAISCRPCSTSPRRSRSPLPGVLSPCGHSTNGKAAGSLPDPAHQPGEARLRRPDVRPGRPGRAQPVLGCRRKAGRAST